MNHDATTAVVSDAMMVDSKAQIPDLLSLNRSIPIDAVTSDAIVQCLLIAARRGRQIRIAREQGDQSPQNGPMLASEEPYFSDSA